MSRLQRFAKLSIPSLALFCTLHLTAQQTPQEPVHAPDGGTVQHIESINIPTIPNAPFTAVVVTEWTRIMPDGSKMILKNHRTVARDNAGRVFQERRIFTPDGDKQPTLLSEVDYEDPNLHELYVCTPQRRVCREYSGNRPSTPPPLQPVGLLPNHMGTLTREDLGHKFEGNLDLIGTREITLIDAGAIGNQTPQPVVKEFWFAPRLGINVTTKRFDPRASADQTFLVTNINQAEPDPTLFKVPDYRVIKEQ